MNTEENIRKRIKEEYGDKKPKFRIRLMMNELNEIIGYTIKDIPYFTFGRFINGIKKPRFKIVWTYEEGFGREDWTIVGCFLNPMNKSAKRIAEKYKTKHGERKYFDLFLAFYEPDIDGFMEWMLRNDWIEELHNSQYDHVKKEWEQYSPNELYIKYMSEIK